MKNSFQIFKSDNKTFHWDLNNFLLLLFLFVGFISILEINIISKIATTIAKCIFLFIFILAIVNIFRKKPLNGVLDGTIIFNQDNIILNDNIITLQEIKKIFLHANDYDGKTGVIIRVSLFPRISNGTNNLLDIELKNGEK
ncbi:hypothetical protein [Flavobacterium sp.]|uniref:hypothetical protein n=1 Tax=Flavobacterium sp. TaxID=239 RepID=UPI003752FBB6